jgi:hypothetical protein
MTNTISKVPWTGTRKILDRESAINEYVLVRMRAEEFGALDYLLKAIKDGRMAVPENSPYSRESMTDILRTCAITWFASFTDRDGRTIYPFDCLLALFDRLRPQIINVQRHLESCHSTVHRFRNNVGPHFNCDLAVHIAARTQLQNLDNYFDVISAIGSFRRLIDDLKADEASIIPELPTVLQKLGVMHLPAFSQYYKGALSATAKGW